MIQRIVDLLQSVAIILASLACLAIVRRVERLEDRDR